MGQQIRQQFLDYRQQFWPPIVDLIDGVIRQAGLSETTLAQMVDYQLSTGGKRLRAVLPLMVAEALDLPPETVLPFGAACELIHNATLVHDDLQDGDRLRRGKEAVWVAYGQAEAINLGDALLYLAPLCLKHLDVDGQRRWQVSQLIYEQVLQVIDGQQQEFELTLAAGQQGYRRMVTGKTSGLFALPMMGAARLCGADQSLIDALGQACRHMGVLFQIQDDVLDLYGEKGREAPGGDLQEGKVSALVVAFSGLASADDLARLTALLEAPRHETDPAEIQWAIDAFRQQGALAAALEEIEELRQKALAAENLERFPALQGLIDGMIDLFVEPIGDVG